MSAPRDDGFVMPPEWAPHARCWMAWPCRDELWGGRLAEACDAYAEVAKAIARFEPVTMIANPEAVAEVSLKCGAGVACLPLPHDDSWLRDSGPTFVLDAAGNLAGVDWIFNSWGERYLPFDKDAALGQAVLEQLGIRRYPAPLVTEGGAIHVDGEGTLLAVENTLMNDNRNPDLSRAEIERLLCDFTGARKVVWLPGGLENDDTDGHVDNVACFAKPGLVFALTCDDKADGNYAPLQANLEVLRGTQDAAGRSLEVIEIPQPRARRGTEGERLALSYVNFYLANDGVIIPAFDDPADDKAYEIFEEVYADRQVVQVPALDILEGGGGIHCITQQQPASVND